MGSYSGPIVHLTIPQMRALLEAADDHRQHLSDNGMDTRALDNAVERVQATLVAARVPLETEAACGCDKGECVGHPERMLDRYGNPEPDRCPACRGTGNQIERGPFGGVVVCARCNGTGIKS